MALLGEVVVVLGQGEGSVQVVDGLFVPPQLGVGAAEAPVGEDAGGGIGQVGGGVGGGLPHDELVVAVPPPPVEGGQGPGQVRHDLVAVLGGRQVRVVGVQPGQRGRVVGQRLGWVSGAGGSSRIGGPPTGDRGLLVGAQCSPGVVGVGSWWYGVAQVADAGGDEVVRRCGVQFPGVSQQQFSQLAVVLDPGGSWG